MKTYTFHVSLPGFGRVWRKVELAADQTLEDLHFAIQNAYDWDSSHLYSFFMSGDPWDSTTEYCLPEDAFDLEDDDLDEDEEWEDEEEEGFEPEIDEATVDSLRASMGDQPPPQSFEEMLSLLQTNDELRSQVKKMMSEQFGVPAFVADLVLGNAGALMGMFGEEMSSMVLGDDDDEEEVESGDVRTTTLDSLELQRGQSFLYLFDYGDEWHFNVRVHAVDENASSTIHYPRVVQIVGEAPPQYPDWEDDEESNEEDERIENDLRELEMELEMELEKLEEDEGEDDQD